MTSFSVKITQRRGGVRLYGIAPPKRATEPERLLQIAEQQVARLNALPLDGIVIYDIQDEAERSDAPRPFPFLPTLDPASYAHEGLSAAKAPKIVYRSVGGDTADSLLSWLGNLAQRQPQGGTVLVGAASTGSSVLLSLSEAYELAKRAPSEILLGGIAIAERHARRADEHRRMLSKMDKGCRYFVTQAVYDATATKSLLSDFYLALNAEEREPVPIILTFSPCASRKTLELMRWLGISFPRWLENELSHAGDPLATSLSLCQRLFEDIYDYATQKGLPLGINVESISMRKAEIDASVELFEALSARLG